MQIFINRNGQKHGPYSLSDVNAYLNSGQLLPTDLAWFEGRDNWFPLAQVPGIVTSQRLPPPPPPLIAPPNAAPQNAVNDERSGCMELTGCFFPVLGLIFWAVYVNSQPNKAKHIGIYTLIGLAVGVIGWLFIASMATRP